MKTKNLFLTALAAIALVSCADSEFVGEDSAANDVAAYGDGSINFGFDMSPVSRADQTGTTAATSLNNMFFVYGIKSESTDPAGTVGAGHTVFKNYVVTYAENTAYTTTSNTKNWEYVGKALTNKQASKITANDGTGAQTIKYWDYGAPDYTFYAFSALPTDIGADKISIVKNQGETSKYDNGYTVTLAEGADLDNLFFSERVNITKGTGTDRTAVNAYGGNVTLRFHKASTKVRVAMYETIDGYSVTINKFTVDNDADPADASKPAFADMDNDVTTNFAANLCNSKGGNAGTLTVTYYDNSVPSIENRPILAFAQTGGPNKVLNLGTNLKANTVLGTSIIAPTYDQAGGTFTSVFPQKDNAQNLKLKVTYTLTAPGTGETITVTDATAEIPADYLKWKPNYSYTYIFKISQNTNGSSGDPSTDPVGLYPITFDAVATITEDGMAEYITTVSEPSITTFGVKGGKYSTDNEDYEGSTAVYAAVEDGSSLATLTASNMKLYTVTTSDATNFPINEASVAEALIEGPTLNAAAAANAKIKFPATPALTYQNEAPAEDGTTMSFAANNIATFTTSASTVYALVYQKTAATYTTDGGKTYADAAAFAAAGTLYQDASCTTVATATYYNGHTGETYYKPTAVSNMGQYVVKIVKAQ